MLPSPESARSVPIQLLTLGTEGKILALHLEGAAKPGVPAFIGAPPKEIERLVADTRQAAQAVADLGETDPIDEVAMSFVVKKLIGVLDRWQPYL
jgi:hypothetical protein